jgi:hypothetical protein
LLMGLVAIQVLMLLARSPVCLPARPALGPLARLREGELHFTSQPL